MKRILFAVVPAMMMFAQGASAQGVAMKKAMKEGDAKIAEAVTKVKEKCGNKSFKASSDYAAVQKMTAFAKKEDRDMENVVSNSGSVAADYVDRLADMCDDADYKGEIAKITEVKFMPDEKLGSSAQMDKKGSVITIKAGPISAASSDSAALFKKLF
jgi:hypothetical protein